LTTKKVLKVVDTGVVPVPTGPISFEEADSVARAGIKPIVVTQPMGPSYNITKGEVSWQNWHFRFRLDPRVGPVVNMVRYQDGEKLRSVLYEGSLSEMYVPYMDPEEGWNSSAFLDAGEFLLGGLIKPVGPDDCPDTAEYFFGYAPTDHSIRFKKATPHACSSVPVGIPHGATSRTTRSVDVPAANLSCERLRS
jgi:primary-amine oxidase